MAGRSSLFLPELVEPKPGRWQKYECDIADAAVDTGQRLARVPKPHTEAQRLARLHEMTHAKHSPERCPAGGQAGHADRHGQRPDAARGRSAAHDHDAGGEPDRLDRLEAVPYRHPVLSGSPGLDQDEAARRSVSGTGSGTPVGLDGVGVEGSRDDSRGAASERVCTRRGRVLRRLLGHSRGPQRSHLAGHDPGLLADVRNSRPTTCGIT
jgi:hypothetical protein